MIQTTRISHKIRTLNPSPATCALARRRKPNEHRAIRRFEAASMCGWFINSAIRGGTDVLMGESTLVTVLGGPAAALTSLAG